MPVTLQFVWGNSGLKEVNTRITQHVIAMAYLSDRQGLNQGWENRQENEIKDWYFKNSQRGLQSVETKLFNVSLKGIFELIIIEFNYWSSEPENISLGGNRYGNKVIK